MSRVLAKAMTPVTKSPRGPRTRGRLKPPPAPVKTGRLVDVKKSSYHNLLLTVGHAMGLQDMATFGQKGNRVLTELTA